MEHIKKYFEKVAEKLCDEKEEQQIVAYGIEQLFFMCLNLVTILGIGFLCKEVVFGLLLLAGLYLLRPYAGGYHANSRWKCYLISVSLVLVFMVLRKIAIPLTVEALLYLLAVVKISSCAPVQNPVNPLEKEDAECYAGKAHQILLFFTALWLISVLIESEILGDSVCAVTVITVIFMIAGKIKYQYILAWRQNERR